MAEITEDLSPKKRGRGRPRKTEKNQDQVQPTVEQPAVIVPIQNSINNQKINDMPEENRPVTQNDLRIRDLEAANRKLETEKQSLSEQLAKANELMKTSVNTVKTNKDAEIERLKAELDKVRNYAKELEESADDDTDNEELNDLREENSELSSKVEAYKEQVADLTQKLDEAEKHNAEIKQNITGKLQIPMDDFARKCYVTWCETYSKDPRWSDNYKQNAAQFEKWGLAPNSLNMPILMVLANMLGKVDSISFDCKIPQDVVVKIAEDCKTQK